MFLDSWSIRNQHFFQKWLGADLILLHLSIRCIRHLLPEQLSLFSRSYAVCNQFRLIINPNLWVHLPLIIQFVKGCTFEPRLTTENTITKYKTYNTLQYTKSIHINAHKLQLATAPVVGPRGAGNIHLLAMHYKSNNNNNLIRKGLERKSAPAALASGRYRVHWTLAGVPKR